MGQACRHGPPCSRARAGPSPRRRATSSRPACRRAASSPPRRPASGIELCADLAAEELDQLLQLEVGGESGGALMTAAAVAAGDRRDVDVALAGAQADLAGGASTGALVADQGGDLGALDRSQVVDDPLRHLLAGSACLVVG